MHSWRRCSHVETRVFVDFGNTAAIKIRCTESTVTLNSYLWLKCNLKWRITIICVSVVFCFLKIITRQSTEHVDYRSLLALATIGTKLEPLRLLSRVKSWAESSNNLSVRLVHLSHSFTCDRCTAFHLSLNPDRWPLTPSGLLQPSPWGKFHAWETHCATCQCAMITHHQRSSQLWGEASWQRAGILIRTCTKPYLTFDLPQTKTHYLAKINPHSCVNDKNAYNWTLN